jgi:hypothetical protein
MRCKAAGGIKQQAILPASMLKSHDGFLYTVTRSTFADEEHDQRFTYTVINHVKNRLYLIVEIYISFYCLCMRCII